MICLEVVDAIAGEFRGVGPVADGAGGGEVIENGGVDRDSL